MLSLERQFRCWNHYRGFKSSKVLRVFLFGDLFLPQFSVVTLIRSCVDLFNQRTTNLTGLSSPEEHHLIKLDQARMSLEKVTYLLI